MVSVSNLRKEFRDSKGKTVHAVDGVSFEAAPGQILGVLGVNGAGKTTLLRMLSTVLTPTSGSASVAGHNVLAEPQKVRANIGFMSTSTALYGRLTPRETLRFFGELYGFAGAALESRVDALIEKFDIGSFSDRLFDKLSTGERQRVSIARTVIHDPPVLFFDEPTAGLDVVTSQTVFEFIEACRDQGKTVLFSTHYMAEAERLCNSVVVIHQGRIRGAGTIDGLKAKTGQPTMEKVFLSLVEFGSSDSSGTSAGQSPAAGEGGREALP